MMLNVNHRLANANHEKTSEKTLYWPKSQDEPIPHNGNMITYNSLDVQEEHTDNTVSRLVQLEEVDEGVLRNQGLSEQAQNIAPLQYSQPTQRMNRSANVDVDRSAPRLTLAHPSRP